MFVVLPGCPANLEGNSSFHPQRIANIRLMRLPSPPFVYIYIIYPRIRNHTTPPHRITTGRRPSTRSSIREHNNIMPLSSPPSLPSPFKLTFLFTRHPHAVLIADATNGGLIEFHEQLTDIVYPLPPFPYYAPTRLSLQFSTHVFLYSTLHPLTPSLYLSLYQCFSLSISLTLLFQHTYKHTYTRSRKYVYLYTQTQTCSFNFFSRFLPGPRQTNRIKHPRRWQEL